MTVHPQTSLRVFLAHSHYDKVFVREVYSLLRADGFDPWLDEEDLDPGQDWEHEIRKSLGEADAVLAFLSRQSFDAAGYLHKELALAFDVVQQQPEGAIFLIPIRLGDSQVPERLRNLHWLDVHAIEGPIGSTYLRLQRSLLRRALQIGLLEGITRTTRRRLSGVSKVNSLLDDTIKGGRWEPKKGRSLGHRKLGIVVSGHYLVRGQNTDGTRYYGVAEISQSEEGLALQANIGAHVLKYVGRLDGAVLAFTGAHDVEYSVERGGSLLGRWGDTGVEELIPASPFVSWTGD